MIYEIENDKLKISVNDFGAELMSIYNKQNDSEYLLDGKEEFWARRSPVLFPFVGLLNNKEYKHAGRTYKMTSHGFARDMEFEMISKADDEIWHILKDNEDTREIYPFNFRLEIGYKLADNMIIVMWKVVNTCDNEDMYFSIGAHPAFNCPLNNDGVQGDYFICFHDTDLLNLSMIDIKSGLLKDEISEMKLTPYTFTEGSRVGLVQITNDLFDNDALVAEQKQAGRISLLKPDKTPYVTVDFDAPLFGVWSKSGGDAPFICIEPWYGRCDRIGFDKQLSEREYVYKLEAGEEFNAEYKITIM